RSWPIWCSWPCCCWSPIVPGGPSERTDRAPVRGRGGAVCAARGVHVALDGVPGFVSDEQPAERPHAARRAADQTRTHPGRRREDRAGLLGAGPPAHVDPHLSGPHPVL